MYDAQGSSLLILNFVMSFHASFPKASAEMVNNVSADIVVFIIGIILFQIDIFCQVFSIV
jgi:hypothetical protein